MFTTLIVLLIGSLITNNSYVKCDNKENGTLTFVHVLYRHGDRTPIKPYETDPWKNVSEWPVDWGQLTNKGKQQHFALGKWLRARYDRFIGQGYSNNITYIRSTDVDRTLMSAQANLAGLFPATLSEQWTDDFNWQPIPVHTIPEDMDWILSAKKPCPTYSNEMDRYKNSVEYLDLMAKYQPLFQYLTNWTGQSVADFEEIRSLYSVLLIQSIYNKTLPEWTKNVYPDGDMKWITDQSFTIDTSTTLLKRLKSGFLLKEILTRLQDKVESTLDPDRRMWIYSAHDTTVASFLNTLGLFSPHFPPYTACVLIELWTYDGDKPYVRIYYKNSTTAEPILMDIPKCGSQCSLDKMFELYDLVLPGQFEIECQTEQFSYNGFDSISNNSALFTIIAICFVLCFIIVVIIFTKVFSRQKYRVGRISG